MKDASVPLGLKGVHVENARLYANRWDALESWPKEAHIAEIGVAFGEFSERIIKATSPALFDAYDLFLYHKNKVAWGRSSSDVFQGKTHREYYEDRFSSLIAAGRLRVYEGDGAVQVAKQDKEFYDVIYIDAGHTYKDVKRDAMSMLPHIKSDGLLIFNDYIMYDHKSKTEYGVVPVVNELCVNKGWRVVYFALQREMFCDIALKKIVEK